ncbi:bifunctional UDP-N-acetylmuramoyl-tripeptide:D-alanyl-D-alanine ligase/alanine racemase [Draconibacterium sp. IB214405]|uniref:bifunctional UDP-N-acetylmuramoyl-tripeptide:D-alanyl-D-alanine ligase/alanine racemase n=1 Tax=Draconibacterium sp. IB214405 TaxID=3097352 RepID=UPI002A139504|nr:bifunctional UDP-N-acetylmuramoyl-tripeptide:D-alanyl-D-alanine ligase/alanine racemase [Draconibacterium sp. IB214405]MDX8340843.1 bifunctional UDP-N-acetylmuramoyl-tripeptide:D-alanyl-D-alanine ligase/alanine racemase [Draconibacterium sp. IB214405]
MKTLTVTDICTVLNGELFPSSSFQNFSVSSIITDSRTFFGGSDVAFIALTGPVFNGHNYIAELRQKGVQLFIISDKSFIENTANYILVEDTTSALQQLAAFNRRHFSYPIIGITGSNGKTIIKEWLYDLLSANKRIVRSPKSYNSQIGVPLSALLLDEPYDLAILEAGISERDEMAKLASVIKPNIGILTNIGDAHQENFSSLEEKLDEKLKLFTGCKVLVFRADRSYSKHISDFCSERTINSINWSLEKQKAPIEITPEIQSDKTRLSAKVADKNYSFEIPFTDESAIENACHCFATLIALKEKPEEFLERFSQLQPVAMRLEIKHGINNCLLINDYYNSDLNSLGIALSVLKQQAAKGHLHKHVILSDIQQTGVVAEELYSKVNQLLQEWGINKLTGIGPELYKHSHVFDIESEFFPNRLTFENHFTRNNYTSSAILIKGARQFEFEKTAALLQLKAHQTVLEINLNALIHNLNTFRKLLKAKTKIMVMVKAFSYGSGDVEIARLLQHQNVDYLSVAVADEGVQLRNAGINVPIVVMNPEQDSFQNIIDFRLEPNIYSYNLLQQFSDAVTEYGQSNYPIHVKIDTGMNRLGLKTKSEIEQVVEFIKSNKQLKISSMFSHLVGSDEAALDEFTLEQIDSFNSLAAIIEKACDYKIEKHILNSAGIERFPNYQFDMVRLGIGLYGISQTGLQLENIGTLKTTVSQVKTVEADETVGYNRKGKTGKRSRIAIVPLGYADGINRKLGNGKGCAFVNGKRAPIVGNICMDMLMLDVNGIEVETGDSVELFGPNISIIELAEKLETIPYEILTGISQRVKRVYLQE